MNYISYSKLLILLAAVLAISGSAGATDYTFELSEQQPWADTATTDTSTSYVTVRAYVPGSNSINYTTIPIYTPTYTSESNALGDVVGSVYHIYGSGTTAFVDPYDGPKQTIIYPAVQILHTKLLAINDDRLAIGNYNVLGGHAAGRGFLYDVIYDQYTEVVPPNTVWTSLADINNLGQIAGTSINDDGASRKGFVYDCLNGFQSVDVPDSSWTVPAKIDDEGNIYGFVSGIDGAQYFIAHPDVSAESNCSLVPREDVAELVNFSAASSFELSGDHALGVKIADFDGLGINDLLVYHEVNKTILYLGETGFEDKVKYYGDEFNSLAEGVELETEWDFNGDGLIDILESNGTDNTLYITKPDGGYSYVPQYLPTGNLKIGDLNGDGLVDIATFSGGYASISYQVTEPVVAEPVIEPDPAIDPEPILTDGDPVVDYDAEKVERTETIVEVRGDSVFLSSGETLWFNAESILKFGDASAFEAGQFLEFKAWKNSDGSLVAIKVEVVD